MKVRITHVLFTDRNGCGNRLGWAPPDLCLPRCICPFRPTVPWGERGQIHCVSTRPLVPREGLYQIHGQSLNTHRGKHRSGGAQLGNSFQTLARKQFFRYRCPQKHYIHKKYVVNYFLTGYNYNYINNCREKYVLLVPLFPMTKAHQLQLHKQLLRGLFWLSWAHA